VVEAVAVGETNERPDRHAIDQWFVAAARSGGGRPVGIECEIDVDRDAGSRRSAAAACDAKRPGRARRQAGR